MWEQITTNPVNMRFHRVLWLFMEIHEIGLHITIPSFNINTSKKNNKPSTGHDKMLIVFTTFDIPGRVWFVIVKPT